MNSPFVDQIKLSLVRLCEVRFKILKADFVFGKPSKLQTSWMLETSDTRFPNLSYLKRFLKPVKGTPVIIGTPLIIWPWAILILPYLMTFYWKAFEAKRKLLGVLSDLKRTIFFFEFTNAVTFEHPATRNGFPRYLETVFAWRLQEYLKFSRDKNICFGNSISNSSCRVISVSSWKFPFKIR